MLDENKESSEFKVVDKRAFTEDGKRRGDESDNGKRAESVDTRSRTGSSGLSGVSNETFNPEPLSEEPSDEGPSEFGTLVSYLSTTAMFQLGLLPGPEGEPIPVDLLSARRMIDLLEVLQEKTRGNLSSDEAKMLEDVLYELRLTFVEVQKRATPNIR